MKIIKFRDFINEEFNDTPETYIVTALKKIKTKIDRMFDFQEEDQDENPEDENREVSAKSIKRAKEDSKKDKMTFKDLGVRLESSEVSKYAKTCESLTVKFSDSEAMYNLYVMIELKNSLPEDPETEFTYKDIKKCFIKFKKYDLDNFDVIGQITKNATLDDINEEYLISLKIELDEEFGEGDEEFEIETE